MDTETHIDICHHLDESQKGPIKRLYVSIKTVIYISLIILILSLSLIISLFFMHFHKDIVEHYISSKGIFAIRILSTEAAPCLIKKDLDHIKEHLKILTSDKDILYAAILTPEGELIVESKKDYGALPHLSSNLEMAKKEPVFLPFTDVHGTRIGYDTYMPIMSKNKQIGLSRIIISFKDIKNTLSHIRNMLIILVCLITLVEGVLCLVISRFINKPMRDLVKAAEKIANGDFNINIPVRSHTEIGLLALSLNKMTDSICQYKDRIINKSNELKAIIDSMGSGLFTIDKEWKITSFNKAAERITGYQMKDVIGKTCQEIFQSDACQTRCPLEKSLKAGRSIIMNDFYIKNKDGQKISVSASTSPLKNTTGEIIGGVNVFKDLSEIKELQKQLIQADKMAALGQMISGIAHDINNPSGVIHSNMITLSEYTEVIKDLLTKCRYLSKKLSEHKMQELTPLFSEIREYENHHDIDYILEDLDCLVEESKEAARRITQIVKDLRDFIHIDVGQLQLADLNQRLDVSLNLIKFDKNIKIVKEYSIIPFVYCNVQQIDQVFTNIILNAAQALGNKGEIRIKTSHAHDRVKIAILDNGPGIPEDIQSKIFDPFFTTKEVGQGTGLGLSICYKIVSKHRGKIWVESDMGKGTEFFVELPLKPSDQPYSFEGEGWSEGGTKSIDFS